MQNEIDLCRMMNVGMSNVKKFQGISWQVSPRALLLQVRMFAAGELSEFLDRNYSMKDHSI